MLQCHLIYNIFLTAIRISIGTISLILLTRHYRLGMKVTFVVTDFSLNAGELYL